MRSLLFLLSISLTIILPTRLMAIQPSTASLDLSILEPEVIVPPNVTTADTVSQDNLTAPSLWWAKQESENKLLDNWLAYQNSGNEHARVDLVVNQQVWTLLDYVERYDFVNRIGTVARQSGYNVRVFDYDRNRLASYTCDFQQQASCSIQMDNKNRGVMRRLPVQQD
ncbi:MAG: hypothetical protein H0X31_14480 [Nostocaceae cyanobacterium]|nr:hypothetical protein [Nostocaceae cyanobacterium]